MSEVKDIIPLKQVSGTKTPNQTVYNWLFKVTTYSDYAGPLQVLRAFPIGKTLESYVYGGGGASTATPSDFGFPICYQWPGFDRCNYPTGWDSAGSENAVRSLDWRAVVTSVSILDRTFDDQDQDLSAPGAEPYSKENRAWYVNVTFTSINDSGIFEAPVITESYIDTSEPALWGKYGGEYRRGRGTGLPETGGVGVENWFGPLELGNPLFTPGDDSSNTRNTYDSFLISNSAGVPFLPPLNRRAVKKVITASWVTPFALDFSRSIGKKNCNKVALTGYAGDSVFFNGYQTQNTKERSEIPRSRLNKNYVVYTEEFPERTLLLENISCELFTVFGRDYYRYTAKMLYDQMEHDVFLLDEGYEISHARGWDVPEGGRPGSSTSTYEGSNSMSTHPIVDIKGNIVSESQLLNGKGRLLMEVNPFNTDKVPDGGGIQGRTQNAVWLRYSIHEEVLFTLPTSDTYDSMEEIMSLECPLLIGTQDFRRILSQDMNPLRTWCAEQGDNDTGTEPAP